MNEQKGSMLTVWLVAAALLLGSSAVYSVAYFRLSTNTTRNLVTGGTCRVYPSMWQAMIFLPASLVESAATGRDVSPAWTAAGP